MMTRMVKGERQEPSPAIGTGTHSPVRGRWRKTGGSQSLCIFRRLCFGYMVAIALGLTWAMTLVGCTRIAGSGRMEVGPGGFFPNVRQSPEELSRILRNLHYYKLMGRPELALKELEQARQQNPDNLKLVNTLAQVYEESGQYEAARKLYKEALTRNGPHPALANNLCFTYYLEGRLQEAEVCYRQTLAHDPGNEAARNNLGLLYCRLGRQDEARRLWQEAEGKAAADYKTRQALAALGMSDSVYAQAPEPAPASLEASTTAPNPVAAVPSPPASKPGKVNPSAVSLAPQKIAMQLNSNSIPEKPVPNDVKPADEVRPQPAPHKAYTSPVTQAHPQGTFKPLTAAELGDTAIEVRNGNGSPNMARRTRTLLNLEGFMVARIGNHVDFGAEQTIIYYRPEGERVAQALGQTLFPGAGLEPSTKLNKNITVKILLGADLIERPQLMARLTGAQK